jgi:hypothetical protein
MTDTTKAGAVPTCPGHNPEDAMKTDTDTITTEPDGVRTEAILKFAHRVRLLTTTGADPHAIAQEAAYLAEEGDAAYLKHTDRDAIQWGPLEEEFTTEFLDGYHGALEWLKTSPPKSEAREIAGLYELRQKDNGAAEGTFYIDADKIQTVVTYCGEYINILDGPAHQAEMVRDHGDSFKAMNLPPRVVSWPGMTPWFQGFELATAQLLDE